MGRQSFTLKQTVTDGDVLLKIPRNHLVVAKFQVVIVPDTNRLTFATRKFMLNYGSLQDLKSQSKGLRSGETPWSNHVTLII